jgi:hypothetical protein
MRSLLLTVLAAASAMTGPARAAEVAPEPDVELETVLVTGEVPGPGLWKITRGEHVLWILGSYGPLPKDMVWRAAEVERRISESQQVIYPGEADISPDIGMLRAVTLLPALLRAGKNPDGTRLQDVLPADTYAKWRPLKEKYLGRDDGVEKWRPAIAADRLDRAAVRSNGLSYTNNVAAIVNRLAKQHRVPVRVGPLIKRKAHVENPRGILKSVQKMELPDAACLARVVDRLEPEIEAMKARANAWARGDVAALRALNDGALRAGYCTRALRDAVVSGQIETPEQARRAIDEMARVADETSRQVEQDWIVAVRAALENNHSTFAVMPMRSLLERNGFLQRLRELDYGIEEPQG